MGEARFHLRQLRGSGGFSYVVWESTSRQAIVVDPVMDALDSIHEIVAREKLRPSALWETSPGRIPASSSALGFFSNEWGVPARSDAMGPELLSGALLPVETEALGRRLLFVRGPNWLFSGDAIPLGSAIPLPKATASLPGETLVLPMLEDSGRLFSTLAVERDYRLPEEADTVKFERYATLSMAKYRYKLTESASEARFVDVRERDEFAHARIPGTECLPLSELAERLPSLPSSTRLYLSCQSGRRSQLAAETLARIGFRDVVNVSGGFQAWSQAGLPVDEGEPR